MSKTKLKHASYSIKKLMDKSHLSFESRHNYQDMLNLIVKQLDTLGYQLDNIQQLKQKHIRALIGKWGEQALSCATIKNRLSVLRHACLLLNKSQVILSNADYGIGNRSYIPDKNKAIQELDIEKIPDAYIRQSLQLQQQFGLRREEAIKFNPSWADNGNYIELKSTWTKGGVGRTVPITTDAQKACLNQAKLLCGEQSLIPVGGKYITQRNLYDRLTQAAGFKNLHGLRHGYAQRRYFSLTQQLNNGQGWRAPIDGGKQKNQLTAKEKIIDIQARKIISREMGHIRISITKTYLGK